MWKNSLQLFYNKEWDKLTVNIINSLYGNAFIIRGSKDIYTPLVGFSFICGLGICFHPWGVEKESWDY